MVMGMGKAWARRSTDPHPTADERWSPKLCMSVPMLVYTLGSPGATEEGAP